MRVRESLPLIFACLLMAGLVGGAILERQGRSGPPDRGHELRAPIVVTYAGGPGEIVLDWRNEAARVVRWQYRMVDANGEPGAAWRDVPGSSHATRQFRIGGLDAYTPYRFEVRPVLTGEPAFKAGDPLDARNWGATTLFVGDDGIPWIREHALVEGGRTLRVDRSDYVIDVPAGMVLALRGLSLHVDGSFSGGIEDWISGSALIVKAGEYVARRVAWAPEGDPWAVGLPNPGVVNEWFDQIVASTRRIPRSGPGPEERAGSCASGAVTFDPASTPGLATDCGALNVAQRAWSDGVVNWDTDTPIEQWDGVTVGGVPLRVLRIELPDRGIAGTIDPAFARLSALTHLDLSGNELTGEIPPDLGALTDLRTLYLAGNPFLPGCVPGVLREIPENDLDKTLLPTCFPPSAGLELEIRAWEERPIPDVVAARAPGTLRTTMVVGEGQRLMVKALRAPWAPVTVEFLTGKDGEVRIVPRAVRFEAGLPGQSQDVRLAALRPGDDIEIVIRTTSTGDREFDDLRDSTLLVTVPSTHLRALVGGGADETALEWNTVEQGVERWQYRRVVEAGDNRDAPWVDVPDSDGSTRSLRVANEPEGWSFQEFTVRPWTASGAGRPSNVVTAPAADVAPDGIPIVYQGTDVESGRSYRSVSFDYVVDVPPDMRLRFGFQVGDTHADGVGQALVDLATGSWILLWSDGRVRARVIASPEVAGEPGRVASLRHAREANRRFDQLLDSLRRVPLNTGDDSGH